MRLAEQKRGRRTRAAGGPSCRIGRGAENSGRRAAPARAPTRQNFIPTDAMKVRGSPYWKVPFR